MKIWKGIAIFCVVMLVLVYTARDTLDKNFVSGTTVAGVKFSVVKTGEASAKLVEKRGNEVIDAYEINNIDFEESCSTEPSKILGKKTMLLSYSACPSEEDVYDHSKRYILFGVEKGIEMVSKILMPALVVLSIGIAIYTLTLPGAGEGLKYYVLPNFDGFTFSMFLKTIAGAMGQLFYSMSLAMGIMVTYGSYMRKQDSIEGSTRQISFFDTLIAFIAGLIIVPSVFVFSGGDASALNKGPSLMFVTLPDRKSTRLNSSHL